MTRLEFHDKIKLMQRRVKIIGLIWTPLAILLSIAYMMSVGQTVTSIALPLLLMVALVGCLWILLHRWSKQLGMNCEHCGKYCIRSRTPETVLATGRCEHCGSRIFSDA